jgi:methylated-DNA-[protein]-cysteine S-methyltransferase
MKKLYFYQTDIGKIGIVDNNEAITNLYFQDETVPLDIAVEETDLLKEAGGQLQDYFLGKLREFKLPLAPDGTEFMRCVWEVLGAIPYGETRSYKEIAQAIGNPKASRAVGLANNRNPIPIITPCHRVIGANGKLTGYRGGLEIKLYLLRLEEQNRSV